MYFPGSRKNCLGMGLGYSIKYAHLLVEKRRNSSGVELIKGGILQEPGILKG